MLVLVLILGAMEYSLPMTPLSVFKSSPQLFLFSGLHLIRLTILHEIQSPFSPSPPLSTFLALILAPQGHSCIVATEIGQSIQSVF